MAIRRCFNQRCIYFLLISFPEDKDMAQLSIRKAIRAAMQSEMRINEDVVLIGEDVAGGLGCEGKLDAYGGVLGISKGMVHEFGTERIIDTPISEMGYMGMAVGAAASGLRPISELMFSDFYGCCWDMLYNQAAKFRYMFGGKAVTPITVRAMIGAGSSAAAQHSQSPYHVFTSLPGMKCVVPSNAYDAKGLLIQAIRDDDPVIFCEHKALYDLPKAASEVPDESYTIPFGEANFVMEGDDITIVALGFMVHVALNAAEELAKKGITCDVIDPRTTSPLDEESILESVEHTGRLIIVDESSARCGFAHDVSAIVADKAFSSLLGPIKLVTPPHTPVPFSSPLEQAWIPSSQTVVDTAMELISSTSTHKSK
jgi:acetoin:2,6-dichlorophenolindophenol oxidoreductase subunit beta